MELLQVAWVGLEDLPKYIHVLRSIRFIFDCTHLQISQVEHFELLEILELVFEARESGDPKPVAVEVKLLECIKRQHLLEVETKLGLDAIQR